jgi:hypothetical protein
MSSQVKLPHLLRQTSLDLIDADADALIAAYGDGAYEQARTRARQERTGEVADSNRLRGHWDKVRREIARRTGRQAGADTATRYLESS